MKRYLFLIIGLLFFAVGIAFCQDVEPIENLGDWVTRFTELQSSLAGVIAQVIFLPPILIGALNIQKKQWKYVLTGAVILILTVLATIMKEGFLFGAKVWFVAVTFGLLELGQIIGYALVPGFFDLIADKFNPWKPKEE
jgi:hypothetical protein